MRKCLGLIVCGALIIMCPCAVRAGVLTMKDFPAPVKRLLGTTVSSRLNAMVTDVVRSSLETDLAQITMSPEMYRTLLELREFMFEHPEVKEILQATD